MPSSRERKQSERRQAQVSRRYRRPLSKLKPAQQALGAATAIEAIERALDLAVFQRELVNGTRAMLGVEISSPDLNASGDMCHSSTSNRGLPGSCPDLC